MSLFLKFWMIEILPCDWYTVNYIKIKQVMEWMFKEGYLVMALIRCPECSREVTDSAQFCPNCG